MWWEISFINHGILIRLDWGGEFCLLWSNACITSTWTSTYRFFPTYRRYVQRFGWRVACVIRRFIIATCCCCNSVSVVQSDCVCSAPPSQNKYYYYYDFFCLLTLFPMSQNVWEMNENFCKICVRRSDFLMRKVGWFLCWWWWWLFGVIVFFGVNKIMIKWNRLFSPVGMCIKLKWCVDWGRKTFLVCVANNM